MFVGNTAPLPPIQRLESSLRQDKIQVARQGFISIVIKSRELFLTTQIKAFLFIYESVSQEIQL